MKKLAFMLLAVGLFWGCEQQDAGADEQMSRTISTPEYLSGWYVMTEKYFEEDDTWCGFWGKPFDIVDYLYIEGDKVTRYYLLMDVFGIDGERNRDQYYRNGDNPDASLTIVGETVFTDLPGADGEYALLEKTDAGITFKKNAEYNLVLKAQDDPKLDEYFKDAEEKTWDEVYEIGENEIK